MFIFLPQITDALSFFLIFSIIQEILVFGCLPEPNQRRGKNIQLENKSIDVFRNVFSFDLVKKDASLKPNFRIQKGKEIFGSLIVPRLNSNDVEISTLEFVARWSASFSSTPLWLYIKKDKLPTKNDFDKTGVSFTSRQFSRLRLYQPEAGSYFIMVEALKDITSLTFEAKLIAKNSSEYSEINRTSIQWPRKTVTIP